MRPITSAITTLLTLGSAMLGPNLSAQEPNIILRQNQLIPNLGTIQSLTRIGVSDQGIVFTQATINGNSLRYMMRDAFPTFVNNLILPEPGPPGVYTATGTFSSFELDTSSNLAWRLQSKNTGTGTGIVGGHTGIYYNLSLIHSDKDSAHTLNGIQNPFFNNPNNAFSSWQYDQFNQVCINNDNQLLINARVDNNGPASGGLATSMILVNIDDQGNIIDETLLLLGTSSQLNTDIDNAGVLNRQNAFDFAENGNWIASVKFDFVNGIAVTSGNDWGIVVNSPTNIIAREGTLIPGIGTVDARGAASPRCAINRFGQTVFMLRVGGANDHIVADGVLIAAEGSSALNLASLAPSTVSNLNSNGNPPLKISDSGDIYWATSVSGATSTNRAFMRNQEVVLRKGVSTIGGVLIRDFNNSDRGYTISNSGRYWAGIVQLAGGGDNAVVLIDYGLVLPVAGSGTNPSTLQKDGGDARIGDLLSFSMDGSQGPGSRPVMYFSLQPAIPGSDTGIQTKFGELLINATPGILLAKIFGSPVTTGPSGISVNIPLDPSLVNLQLYTQGIFLDVGATNGGNIINMTNGVSILVGAP